MRVWRNRVWAALVFGTTLVVLSPEPVTGQTGAIAGTVELQEARARGRRTARRYPGGATGTATIQQVPVVVYVLGPFGATISEGPAVHMVQRDTTFVPSALTIPVGGTVEFPNEDSFFHNVFSYSSTHRFDLGRYPVGESKSEQFQEAGVVEVFCEVHDKMRGVIVVTENPFHAVVGEDGSFRIDGIPAGEYQVAFWSADHRPSEQTITVTAGSTSNVEVELSR